MPDSTNEDAAPPATTPRRNPKPEIDEIGGRKLKPSTLMMGHGFEPALSEGSLKPPIFAPSTFVFPSTAAGKRHFAGIPGQRPGRSETRRVGNAWVRPGRTQWYPH